MPMRLLMVSSRCMALALVLLTSIAGLSACGDSGASRSRDRTVGEASRTNLVPTAPRSADRSTSDEYKGPYAEGKEICGESTHKKVAAVVGSKSTRPRAIARALVSGYKPRVRKQIYAGCLAGLR
jgi:hypothetical protein